MKNVALIICIFVLSDFGLGAEPSQTNEPHERFVCGVMINGEPLLSQTQEHRAVFIVLPFSLQGLYCTSQADFTQILLNSNERSAKKAFVSKVMELDSAQIPRWGQLAWSSTLSDIELEHRNTQTIMKILFGHSGLAAQFRSSKAQAGASQPGKAIFEEVKVGLSQLSTETLLILGFTGDEITEIHRSKTGAKN